MVQRPPGENKPDCRVALVGPNNIDVIRDAVSKFHGTPVFGGSEGPEIHSHGTRASKLKSTTTALVGDGLRLFEKGTTRNTSTASPCHGNRNFAFPGTR